MAASQLEQWRAARASAGTPLPDAGAEREAVTVTVDGVEVGGAVLAYSAEPSGRRCAVLLLQTTVPYDAVDRWTAIARGLEDYARRRAATEITTAVAPALAAAFGHAGFLATMLGAERPFGPNGWAELHDDGRVTVRPMDLAERQRFVGELRELMLSGMTRAGVVEPGSPSLEELKTRLVPLLEDPLPADQLVLTALIDGAPGGGLWATLAPVDGGREIHAHALQIDAEHRGRGLGRSFLSALNTYVAPLGARGVRLRVYGFDRRAQQLFGVTQDTVEEIHLRKDIAAEDAALR
ncbi:GNAT family N-acetyltransferase [Nocardioides nematodiphilus]|uniref:GNAT family N-acetyltransferase n=1 Tax=Nocardioides nematodiphilus TaxID=2849669 RepID=UPI001CD92F45|nr:GNAT family N-acetyltransferase [Nocardioides nematodiphilus]MCA1983399.1 GNAT family N-acetyltransferase [Nocardioides nematodiphilus]